MAGKNANCTINTDYMTIEGNMIKWSDTIIQISNISIISTSNVVGTPFPFLSIVFILAGFGAFALGVPGVFFGILVLAGVGIWLYSWYKEKQKQENMQKLSILMNSGLVYSIIFNDKKFLTQVMKRFAEILSVPNNKESFTINIKDNVFRDGAQANVRM